MLFKGSGIATLQCISHFVGNLCGMINHGTTTFSNSFLRQQHTAHIGMVNNGIGHFFRIFFTGQGTH